MAVAEFAGNALRCSIVLKYFGQRGHGAKFLKGQVQKRSARLGAEALALKLQTKPGTGFDLSQHRKITPPERNHANGAGVMENT